MQGRDEGSLYYHNLPNVSSPNAVQYTTRLSLGDIEKYLENSKSHQQKLAPLFRWELCGYYYELFSEEFSKTEITSILSKEHKIKEITKSGEEELPLAQVYPKQRIIELNHYIDLPQYSQLKVIDGDKNPVLEFKEAALDRIGKDIKLPHYRVEILPFNESDESHQILEKFFDENHEFVQIIESAWVSKNGIIPRMQKTPYKLWNKKNRIELQRKEWKNHAIHLKKLPASEFIAVPPNIYQIQKQLSAIRKLKHSPLSEHRPLIRLFEINRYANWPDVRQSEGGN